MFGYQGGESEAVVLRKTGYRADAQRQWNFLTTIDLSSIKNPEQLCSMIQVRSSVSAERAKKDVDEWMHGKTF